MNDRNKADVHGVPGETARARGVMRAIGPLLAALFACGIFCGAVLPRITLTAAGAGFVLAAAFLVWAVRDGLRGIEAFFKGARGEEMVAVLLADLPGGYHVFHDFACGPQRLDHVVVGPSGVFAIETKCWAGHVTLDGGELLQDGRRPERSPIKQVRRAALDLTAFTEACMGDRPVSLLPVVCFAGDAFVPEKMCHEDVVICNGSLLKSVILEHAGRLSADVIDRLVLVMEHQ